MKHFSTRETARILETTEAQVRNYARLGQIIPQRGPGRRLEFSFQELLLLKTTKGLVDSGVPARHMRRIWSSLRRQLAADLPLTSITIFADGHRAIAWDGNAQWQPDSGQFVLNFNVGEIAERAAIEAACDARRHPGVGALPPVADIALSVEPLSDRPVCEFDPALVSREGDSFIALAPDPAVRTQSWPRAVATEDRPRRRRRRADAAVTDRDRRSHTRPAAAVASPLTAEQWFNLGYELEGTSPLEARQAYHQALEIDPDFADAHVNLGRHYHEAGELGKAEAHYRDATRCAPEDATCHFNLGVLLEDRGRPDEAIHAYEQAIARDPDAADAHYNLGLLFEALGRRSEAIRHLMIARQLYTPASRGE